MKTVTIFLTLALLFSGCKSEEKKQERGKIGAQKLCQAADLQTAQKLTGKKLHTNSKEEQKLPYAVSCSIEDKDGFPYFTVTLYYNEKNRNLKYFAPPGDLFNSVNKKIADNTVAVIAKKDKNTIEILKKGADSRIVAITPLKVKALDGSANQSQLINMADAVLSNLQK